MSAVLIPPAQRRSTTRRRVLAMAALVTVLAVAIAVLPGHRGWFDVGVYHGAVGHWVRGGDLYQWTTGNGYGFTYPPFAAVSMLPMAALAWYPTIVANLLLTALAVAFLLHLLVDPLARRYGWSRWYALALACCLLAGLNPVRDTVSFGQVNLLLVALVYLDLWLLERGSPLAGVGAGLAAAVKLTPAIFIGYLLVTGRWRAAATAIGTAVGATVLAAAVAPDATGPSSPRRCGTPAGSVSCRTCRTSRCSAWSPGSTRRTRTGGCGWCWSSPCWWCGRCGYAGPYARATSGPASR
ncbi:hypothetical protein GCM10027614_13280 [Micromonospora vulcania]